MSAERGRCPDLATTHHAGTDSEDPADAEPILTRGLVLVACLMSAGALAPTTALADGPLALRMQVGGTCVAGHKPTGDPITVKLLRSDGTTRATRTDSTTELEWKVCFSVPVAGERVKLSTSFAPVRTVRIPVLTAVADRVTNVVTGRGPAGGELSIKYYSCHPGECSPAPSRLTTVNSQGRYHKDLSTGSSPADIDGSDKIEVSYQNSHNDSFTRTTYAPYMEIKAPNTIHVSCLPKGTTTLKLRSSGGTLRATRSFTLGKDCGSASGSFRKNGDAVNVHVGDRVTADFASDASLKWPVMAVTAPAGRTPADRPLRPGRRLQGARERRSARKSSSTPPTPMGTSRRT